MRKISKALGNRIYALISAIVTMGLSFLIWGLRHRLWGENSLFIFGDGIESSMWGGAFSRIQSGLESVDYCFSLGLGAPGRPQFGIYTPFSLITYGDANSNTALVTFAMIATAAYTFTRFSEITLRKKGIFQATLGVCYALCGYVIIFFHNTGFLHGLYMLPLIVRFLAEYVGNGKGVKLCLAYAYLFLTSYFSGYVCGIFSFVIFLVLLFTNPQSVQSKIKLFVKFCILVLIAAMSGAFYLLPTAQYLLSGIPSDGTTFQAVKMCSLLDVIGNMYWGKSQGTDAPIALGYSGLMAVITVPLIFVSKKTTKKGKIIAGILLGFLALLSTVLPFYAMIHMFNAPDSCGHRYSYLYSFVLCSIAAYVGIDTTLVKKKVRIIVTSSFVLLYLVVWGIQTISSYDQNKYDWHNYLINVVFLGIYILILCFCSTKKRSMECLLCLVMLCECALNGWINIAEPDQVDIMEVETINIGASNDFSTLEGINEYRVTYSLTPCINIAMGYGYMGLGYFTPVESAITRFTMGKLGYAVSARVSLDYGGTEPVERLLGVRYEVIPMQSEDTKFLSIQEREKYLPLAYMVSGGSDNLTLDSNLAPININKLYSAFSGENINVFDIYQGDIEIISDNVKLVSSDKGYYLSLKDENQKGEIAYYPNMDNEKEVYVQFGQEVSKLKGNSPIVISGGWDSYNFFTESYLALSHMIKLEKNDEGKYYVKLSVDPNICDGTGEYTDIVFASINRENLENVFETIYEHKAEDLTRQKDRITFSVIATEDYPILFTSIPFDKGWKMKVDGDKTEVVPIVDNTFCGAILTPGEHHIEMYYDSFWNRLGFIISICGLVGLLVLVIVDYGRKKSKGNDAI